MSEDSEVALDVNSFWSNYSIVTFSVSRIQVWLKSKVPEAGDFAWTMGKVHLIVR